MTDSFRRRLIDLYERAGQPPTSDLERLSALSGSPLRRQRVHDLLKGTGMPQWRTVATFLRACAAYGRFDVDLAAWQARYNDARRQRPVGPLVEPYREVDEAETPVRLLRAEYRMVPFQSRDELTVLLEWCQRVAAEGRTGLVVVHGVGGAGKTRLALELADRLGQLDWYAGVLPRNVPPTPLTAVDGPVLAVLDYADGRVGEATALLRALRARTDSAAVVVLTARSVDGQWLTEIIASLDDDRHVYRREDMRLPDQHPDPVAIYQQTALALDTTVGDMPTARDRWTTLDLVLLAWLRANSSTVTTRAGLYAEVLRHEENYWTTVYRGFAPHDPAPDRSLLRRAAAVVTLVAPADERTEDAVLTVVPGLADDQRERRLVRRVLRTCLDPDPGEGLALRPDPVGDHLLRAEFLADPELLPAAIRAAGPGGVRAAVATVDRAGHGDPELAVAAITGLLESNPDWWRDVLAVAAEHTGPALTALTNVVTQADSPLPLAEVSAAVPFSPVGLFGLGLALDRELLERADDRAPALVRAARRATDAGDHVTSLTWVTEAVDRYRSAGDTAGLAEALRRRSGTLSRLGRQEEALASGEEAVELLRNSDNDLELAAALVNLSAALAALGRTEAVDYAEDAVATYRRSGSADELALALVNLSAAYKLANREADAFQVLVDSISHYQQVIVDSPEHLPRLAAALHNAGLMLSDEARHEEAVTLVRAAVDVHRLVAQANPAAYLPDLALSLSVLSDELVHIDSFAEAVETSQEAVDLGRRLAADPTHLRDLVARLGSLGGKLLSAGQHEAAVDAISEAVGLFRRLDATAVNDMSVMATVLDAFGEALARVGRTKAALAATTEAVALLRRLAKLDGTRYLPGLAMSIFSQSARLAELDRHAGALVSAIEGVAIFRSLVHESPALLPRFAASLIQLGTRLAVLDLRVDAQGPLQEGTEILRALPDISPAEQADLATAVYNLSHLVRPGDMEEGLATAEESVAFFRDLSGVAMYRPRYANALHNLATCLDSVGRRQEALSASYESLAIRRELAAENTVWLADVADSTDTIAGILIQLGTNHDEAHELLGESITIRRGLAATDPDAHQLRLGSALGNLVGLALKLDRPREALDASAESVAIYREFAPTDVTLAEALVAHSAALTVNGDTTAALAAVQEAVDEYRTVVRSAPGYREELAVALRILGQSFLAMARTEEARDATSEATDIQQDLAMTDPVGHLPRLIASLTLLAAQSPDSIVDRWRSAVGAMPNRPAQARLRAALANHLRTAGDIAEAVAELRQAAVDATPPPADPSAAVVLGQARWAIRELAGMLGLDDLPAWATNALDQSHVDVIARLAEGDDVDTLPAALGEERHVLADPALIGAAETLIALNPQDARLTEVPDVIRRINDSGVEALFAQGQVVLATLPVLKAWAIVPDRVGFYLNHREALDTEAAGLLLTAHAGEFGADTVRQFRTILDLGQRLDPSVLSAVLTDPTAAENAVLTAVEGGDLDQLAALAAAPALAERPTTAALAAAVVELRNGRPEVAAAVAQRIVDEAPPVTRRAHAVRLRALQQRQPDLTGLDGLITLIDV